MNNKSQPLTLNGAAGPIQALLDAAAPGVPPRGLAVVCHPHPLFGGTMHNKVVQTLARAFAQSGWHCVRLNFRGVGASSGSHDHGVGETEDCLAVVAQASSLPGLAAPASSPAPLPLALAGFSFGAVVAAQALVRLWPVRPVAQAVLVGTAVSRFALPPLPLEAHGRTLLIHGERDDTVPLAAVMDWARPQSLPVTVVPGGEHFFHGQLSLLKGLVLRHLQAGG